MMVACPNCGAENPLENAGQEIVCISCFSVWVPEAGSELPAEQRAERDEAEDTYQGQTISLDVEGDEIDPLNLDLGVAEPDAEDATAFAMEAVIVPDGLTDGLDSEAWPDATLESDVTPSEETTSFAVDEAPEGSEGAAGEADAFTYTRSSTDIIQEEAPFENEEHSADAMGQTTVAGAGVDSGGTEAFGAGSAGSSSDYDDPFADFESSSSPSSSSSSGYDDPFANAEADSPATSQGSLDVEDPFAVDVSLMGQAEGGGNLDGMEELDFGSLGGGGEDLSGGFEVDTVGPDTVADESAPRANEDDASEDSSSGSGGRKGGRGRARRRKSASGGKAKQVVGLLLGVVVLAGVALGQFTDMGYFGMNLILGGGDSAPAKTLPPRPVREAVKKPSAPATVSDAPTDYVKRIAALELKLKESPKDKALLHELSKNLMSFQERHKSAFDGNADYAKRLAEVLDPEQLKADKQMLIQKMLVEGKTEDAEAALEALKAEKISDPNELYLMAKVARTKGEVVRAVVHYKRALELNPGFEPAIVDLAKIHLEKKEIAEAKALYTKLLEMNPNQIEAQVELAQIALFEKDYEGAHTLAAQALASAQKAGDTEGTHAAYWLKARLAEAQGLAPDRLAALEQAIVVRPKDEQTVLALADVLRKQGNDKGALVRLQAAETAGLKSPAFFRALIGALVASGKEEEARKKLEDGLVSSPDDTGLLMIQAEEKIRGKQLKTAKGLYSKVIELKPGSLSAYLGLTKLLVGEGKIIEATQLLEGAVDKVDEKQPLLEKTAELQMQAGLAIKARETMAKILKVNPNDLGVKLRFAGLLKGLGIYDESARYFEALELAGALEPAQAMDYAEVLSELGRRDKAMAQVDSLLASDPLNLRANILRGNLNTQKGEFKKAEEDLKRALKIKDDSASALYYVGLNELAQKRIEEAIASLTKANSVESDNLEIRDALARAYTDSGTNENQRAALSQYSFIIEQYESWTSPRDRKRINPDVYLRRGRLFFKLSQHKKALKDFGAAMVLEPDRKDLLIQFAQTLQKTGKDGEADAYLRKVLEQDKRNPAAHYYLGESLMKGNNLKGAEKHFKEAVAGGGADFPVAYRHLGYIYKDQKLTRLACDNFKKFNRFAPASNYEREEVARLVEKICK
jgi:tetratricopeptide (TPR) repeat protein